MHRFAGFEPNDLKLIYRSLHRTLLQEPELLDSDFFTDLQLWLQARARAEGVDVGLHAAWDAWLQGRTDPSPPLSVVR